MILSYLWLLALVPLLAAQEDKEVQWHAKHGLVITGLEFALYMVLWLISLTGFLSCLTCLAYIPLLIAGIVVRVLCIDKALKGGRFTVPGLSELADRF
jgi:uncharacterized membrane protein